jgi:hypothetical protein
VVAAAAADPRRGVPGILSTLKGGGGAGGKDPVKIIGPAINKAARAILAF